jgi:hypothetical protein
MIFIGQAANLVQKFKTQKYALIILQDVLLILLVKMQPTPLAHQKPCNQRKP